MSIFGWGKFIAASGQELDYKIMCDDFTQEDWDCLAQIVLQKMGDMPIKFAVGVPSGGLPFAKAIMRAVCEGPIHFGHEGKIIVCEDVWTTGGSVSRFMNSVNLKAEHCVIWTVFARGPLIAPARALFLTEDAAQA